jgi:hypothetical protein
MIRSALAASILVPALGAGAASPPVESPVREVRPIEVKPRVVAPAVQASVPAASKQPKPQSELDAPVHGGRGRGPGGETLEFVDAGIADVGPIARSFRLEAEDLRLPTGFQRVYRVPGSDDRLMRGNGALFAVFPTSVYRQSARGDVPVAPASVVYHFGVPDGDPMEALRRAAAAGPHRPIDFRVATLDGRPLREPGPTQSERDRALRAATPAGGVDASTPEPQPTDDPFGHLGFGPQR